MSARSDSIAAVLLTVSLVGCGENLTQSPPLDFGRLSPTVPMVNATAPEIPPAPSRSTEDFTEWQRNKRESLLKLLPLDARREQDPEYRILSTTNVETSGLTRSLVVFRSFDGAEIPAVLQHLDPERPRPGVLVIPGHVTDRELGINESGLQAIVAGDSSYQKAAATKLAMAGFVTLSFELRGFGLLGSDLETNHLNVALNAIAQGSSYKALVLQDAQFAFELLQSLPQTDPSRVATAGASYGGELAVALAALDERVAAVSFSSYGGRVGSFGLALGRHIRAHHYCHVIPGSQAWLRREDIFLLVAPRPMQGFRGSEDSRLHPAFNEILETTWRLSGSRQVAGLQLVDGGGHEFFVDETLSFLTSTFGLK